MAKRKLPGLSVTVMHKGEVLLQKGYGHADLERKIPVVPSKTLFRIASISKCITGMAFAKMVEGGLLDWDDSLYKHVPYFPKKKYDFTLRQLASHTAGVRTYKGKEYALDIPFSIKESLSVFKDDALVFEPAKGYLYNSFGFVLLSLAMQEVCGIPIEDYMGQNVLRPMGMFNTVTPLETDKRNPSAEFYTKRGHGFRKATTVNNFYKLAGGGYLSTSIDIAKMGHVILKGGLLRRKSYNKLLSTQQVNGKPTYYGLGFQVSQDAKGRPYVGHVGNSVGTYTNFFAYPGSGHVFSILINCTDPKVQQQLDVAIDCIIGKATPV